jgi:hypothetical protein
MRNRATKIVGMIAAIAAAFGLARTAQAELIQNGGFEDFTGTVLNAPFVAGNTSTYGVWIDRAVWRSVDGASSGSPAGYSGNNFALQNPASNNQTNTVDLLIQGFDATGLTALTLNFDYIFQAGLVSQLTVYGLDSGETWDKNAPFPCAGCDELYSEDLADAAGWAPITRSIVLSRPFTAVAFGWTFGGTTEGIRGVDNVSVTAVPEPGTLALFGAGLIGLGFAGLRRRLAR